MTPDEGVHVLVLLHPLEEQKKFEDAIRTIVEQVAGRAGRLAYERGLADGKRIAIN